jgi:tRNA (guanine26-N2/guanine27-N2)-dimethyltransferase
VDILEDIDLTLVKEGEVEVEVPTSTTHSFRGPARADAPVFYNPAMTLARDVSVAVLRAAGKPSWRVLDGLAGTGIRGTRYAVEGPTPREVVLNDLNPVAGTLCQRNLERNGVTGARVTRHRLEVLLLEETFDMVDIDPFGSPVAFLPGAVRGVRRGGLMAVTATDTPALCGSKPKPCLRRYGARPWRGDAMHEVALRILAGTVVREAARVDRAAAPVLSMAEDHYVRVFLHVEEGARRADAALGRVGFAWSTSSGGVGTGPDMPVTDLPWTGPLWLGPLHDAELLEAMASDEMVLGSKRAKRLLSLWQEEVDLPPLFVATDSVASRLGVQVPRMSRLVEELRTMGYSAGRAHTNPVGVKTDAPMEELDAVFCDLDDGA